MSEVVAGKIRKQYSGTFLLFGFNDFFCIVAGDDPLDCAIDRLRLLHTTISVGENESGHTVKLCITTTVLLLLLSFHLKGIVHNIQHGDCTDPGLGLWLRDPARSPPALFQSYNTQQNGRFESSDFQNRDRPTSVQVLPQFGTLFPAYSEKRPPVIKDGMVGDIIHKTRCCSKVSA